MNAALSILSGWLERIHDALGEVPALAGAIRAWPWPTAVAGGFAVAGAALLVAGSRFRRAFAAVGGGAIGWLAGLALAGWAGQMLGAGPLTAAVAGSVLLAAGGAAVPALYPIALCALPGALAGAALPIAGRAWLGALLGATLLGVLGHFAARWIRAATAALLGAVAVAVALVAAAAIWPPLAVLVQRPILLAGIVALLAAAGTTLQLAFRAGPARRQDGKDIAPA